MSIEITTYSIFPHEIAKGLEGAVSTSTSEAYFEFVKGKDKITFTYDEAQAVKKLINNVKRAKK